MTRYLYISPHLDDAVLSAGVTIACRLEAGDEVSIVTIFSGREQDGSAEETDVYARRRGEDQSATALLATPGGSACESLYLGLPDAPFRDSHYASFQTIVNGSVSRESNTAVRVALSSRLESILEQESPDALVAPLAVGRHVDHRLVFEAIQALDWDGEHRFYEDQPYAFVPGAVNHRWSSLGATPGMPRTEHAKREFPPMSFLADYRHEPEGEAERQDVMHWRWGGRRYEPREAAPSAAQLRRRTLAIAAYESQLPSLFDVLPETAEAAIDALYGSRSEVEWCPAVVDLPAKER